MEGSFVGGNYETKEEAIEAAEREIEMGKTATEIEDFTESLFGGERAEEMVDRITEAISQIQITPEGFVVNGQVFPTLEAALATIMEDIKNEMLDERKKEVIEDILSEIKSCDGDFIKIAAGNKTEVLGEVKLSDSVGADINDLYADTLKEIAIGKATQRTLNSIMEEMNAILKSDIYTQASKDILFGYFQENVEHIEIFSSTKEAEDFLNIWKEQVKKLRVYKITSVEAEAEFIITGKKGFPLEAVLEVKKIQDNRLGNGINQKPISAVKGDLSPRKVEKITEDSIALEIWDINIILNQEQIPLEESCIIEIKIGDKYLAYKNFALVYSGEKRDELIACQIENGVLTAEVDHFSEYILVAKPPHSLTAMCLSLGAIALLAIARLILSEIESRKQRGK